jgi:hypothetical protein
MKCMSTKKFMPQMIVKAVYFPLQLYIFYSVLTQTCLLSIGKDVLAKARTGTGKTVAFLVSTLLNTEYSFFFLEL